MRARKAFTLLAALVAAASGDVLTQHNDNARTGATLNETILNTSNVNAAQFGKLYTRIVDGDIYAQPLYVAGVNIPGKGVKNVVYVATVRNNIYAFDADNYDADPAAGRLWGPFHLGEPEQGRTDLNGKVPGPGSCASATYYGIVSTPVIDRDHNWMYLVAKTIDGGGRAHQMLHRIDIRTGAGANPNAGNTPKEIVYPDPTNPAPVAEYGAFNPAQLNRAGLLLSQGNLYVAFAAHCDAAAGAQPHGWMLGYNAQTLAQIGGFNTTPHAQRGGIWHSGNGPAADPQGSVYFYTGNMANLGEPRHVRDATDFSQMIIRIGANLRGPVAFPPRVEPPPWYLDYHRLDAEDLDVTSGGPLYLPDTGDLVGGGKTGRLYLLDHGSMEMKQTFRATVNTSGTATPETCTYGPDHYPTPQQPNNHGETLCPHIHTGMVYWHGPEGNIARVYVWGERDYLRSYRYDLQQKLFITRGGAPLAARNDLTAPDEAVRGEVLMPLHDPNDGSRIMPGASLSLSANGSQAGSGILWAAMVLRDNAEYKNVYGVLRAFDALTLKELWNSGADQFNPEFLGRYAKYAAVTVANGNVFAPTFSNRLVIYGPLSRRRSFTPPWQEWGELGAQDRRPPYIIPPSANVTPVARDSRHLDVYLADSNGAVLNGGWWAAGDQWHDGYPISPTGFVRPGTTVAALSREAGSTDLYVVRTDGSIWNAGWWSAATNKWNPAYPIAGAGPGFTTPDGTVTAVARTPQDVDLYAVRSDGSVWNAGWWSGSTNRWNPGYAIAGAGPGFARPGTPVAVLNRTRDVTDLYVVRSDGSVWNAGWWTATPNRWNPGYSIPGAGPGFAPPGAIITAAARTPVDVDLYVVRSDGSVWNAGWWSQATNRWNPGYPIPGAGPGFARPGSRVTVINRTAGITGLYVVRPDGTVWNAGWWSAQPNRWIAGYRVGLNTTVDPAAAVTGVSRSPSHVDLFVPGKNGQILSPWWDLNVR